MDEIRELLKNIKAQQGCTHDQAVRFLGAYLDRSPATIYGWLTGRPVPDMVIRLIKIDPPIKNPL